MILHFLLAQPCYLSNVHSTINRSDAAAAIYIHQHLLLEYTLTEREQSNAPHFSLKSYCLKKDDDDVM